MISHPVTLDEVVLGDPVVAFAELLRHAEEHEADVPNAMTLATVDASGQPHARTVLLKGVDERGFVFYTNYRSVKGQQLAANPAAALCFHWKTLGWQVRIRGRCSKVAAVASTAYFHSRAQPSQLAAIASAQSQAIPSRLHLEQRFQELRQEYGERLPPRPDHWGGYCLAPEQIELWQHRDDRLHERHLYKRVDDAWQRQLLAP